MRHRGRRSGYREDGCGKADAVDMDIEDSADGASRDFNLNAGAGLAQDGKRLCVEPDFAVSRGVEQVFAADSDMRTYLAAGWADPGDGGYGFDGEGNSVARLPANCDHDVTRGRAVGNSDGDAGVRPGKHRSSDAAEGNGAQSLSYAKTGSSQRDVRVQRPVVGAQASKVRGSRSSGHGKGLRSESKSVDFNGHSSGRCAGRDFDLEVGAGLAEDWERHPVENDLSLVLVVEQISAANRDHGSGWAGGWGDAGDGRRGQDGEWYCIGDDSEDNYGEVTAHCGRGDDGDDLRVGPRNVVFTRRSEKRIRTVITDVVSVNVASFCRKTPLLAFWQPCQHANIIVPPCGPELDA
jgi:hypothetical protein